MSSYNPLDWYWLATDGRLFGSRRAGFVISPADDADYQAWRASGAEPTPWPRDSAGAETALALSEVTEPYGVFTDLVRYAAHKRWQVECGGISVGGLAVPTDDRAKMLISGAAATLGDADTIQFKSRAGWVVLTGEQLRAVRAMVTAHVQACFAAEAAVAAGIAAGTITSIAAVDAAAWPSTN